MKTLFDSSLYQFDTPQPSYWEASAGDLELQCKPLTGAHNRDVASISPPVSVITDCGIFSISRSL